MELITYSPIIFGRNGFPVDDNGNPYIPGNIIKEALDSAVIFYYIKKDKDIENKVRKYLIEEKLNIKEVSKKVKEIVFEKHPILENLEIPEIISIPKENIQKEYIEVFDLKEWIDTKGFKTEIFSGVLNIPIKSPHLEKLKAAAHSYAEALAKIEHSFLKEHPLSKHFYQPLINEMKRWEIPLRIGMWTEVSFKGDLLFFWRIKEVRERLMKELNVDIKPGYVLYIPKLKQTAGWSYLEK